MKGHKELIETVKMIQATGGMDTDETSICEYQDMIGHSSQEQLTDLATGNYRESFYRLYCAAYGVINTLRFYWNFSDKCNSLREVAADREAEIDKLNFLLEEEQKATKEQKASREEVQTGYADLVKDYNEAKRKTEEQAAEIIQLKAKLYDLMTK